MLTGHVHNINYIDFVTQIMPIKKMQEAKVIEVLYKKEIRDIPRIKCFYGVQENKKYVVIKSENEEIVYAIVRLS